MSNIEISHRGRAPQRAAVRRCRRISDRVAGVIGAPRREPELGDSRYSSD